MWGGRRDWPDLWFLKVNLQQFSYLKDALQEEGVSSSCAAAYTPPGCTRLITLISAGLIKLTPAQPAPQSVE